MERGADFELSGADAADVRAVIEHLEAEAARHREAGRLAFAQTSARHAATLARLLEAP